MFLAIAPVPRHWKHAGFVAKNNAEPQMQKHCGVGFVGSKDDEGISKFLKVGL